MSQLFITAIYIEGPNKITSKYVFKSYSYGISERGVEESDTDDSATSMGDDGDDDGDILKEFLSI